MSTMVPAPTMISGTSAAIRSIAAIAAGVRNVNSMIGRPPSTSALCNRYRVGRVVDDHHRNDGDDVEQ